MRRAISVVLYIAATVAMAAAAVDAGRIAWADWLAVTNTPESVVEAVRLDPGNATFHGLLAEHLEALGQDPKPQLKIATALSPAESRYWERLAFRAEVEHDDNAAEQYLLHAAEVDKMFAPRWSLVNFYLRRGDKARGDMDKFWEWLEKSFQMSLPYRGAIFQVAWAVSQDENKIRSILPRDHDTLREYVGWLVENRPVGDTLKPALELAAESVADDVPVLLSFCDKTAPMNLPSALEAWNSMCRRKLLPCAPLNPESGQVVTNSSFSGPPLQRGFDWTLSRESGVSEALAESGSGLVVQLSGKQAEHSALVAQSIPLAGGKHYRLSWEYKVSGNGGPTGLYWELTQPPRSTNLLTGAPGLRATEWATGQEDFESGNESASRLALFYRREPGMIPWEGTLYLRKIEVQPLP